MADYDWDCHVCGKSFGCEPWCGHPGGYMAWHKEKLEKAANKYLRPVELLPEATYFECSKCYCLLRAEAMEGHLETHKDKRGDYGV